MSAGGTRTPGYLYEMALARVEDLMRQAIPWPRICAILSDEGYTDSADTAKNWRRVIMARWADEEKELRPARKDLWRERLEHLYRTCLERAATMEGYPQAAMMSEAIKVAKLAIVLDGVQAPIVVNHTGIDVSAMSPMEREKEIAELLRRRDEALAKAQAAPPARNN